MGFRHSQVSKWGTPLCRVFSKCTRTAAVACELCAPKHRSWWKTCNGTTVLPSVMRWKGFNPAETFQSHLPSSEMSLRRPAVLHTSLCKYCFLCAIFRRVSIWADVTWPQFPFTPHNQGTSFNYQAPLLWNQFQVSVCEAGILSTLRPGLKPSFLIKLIVRMT